MNPVAIKRLFTLALPVFALMGHAAAAEADNPFSRIGHIVVIYIENRSFDHVFGLFPGADGVNSVIHPPQVDFDGLPLPFLPAPPGETRLPKRLPNAPFRLDPAISVDDHTMDPTHDFYVEQEQINGGRMDRFVEASNAGALVMGYYDGSVLKQWALAKEFTLADHFFHGAFGGSMLNHFFLICACAPVFENPAEAVRERLLPTLETVPDGLGGEYEIRARRNDSPRSVLDGPPRYEHFGRLTTRHEAVGTLQPRNSISIYDDTDPQERLPPFQQPTIGDRLSARNISWAWYTSGWRAVVNGRLKPYKEPREGFQTHHQPFVYFANYAEGTPGRAHLKDLEEMLEAADKGELPAVSFYKPSGRTNGHPGYSDLAAEDAHVSEVIGHLRASPNWADMLIIVTSDENGGFWDHVAPPRSDRLGPGARVPAIIVSPFAKKGFVDKTIYDTASILRTIEVRFGLEPLGTRDAAAMDLRNVLAP